MPFDIEDITGQQQSDNDPGKGKKTSSPGFDPSDVKAAAEAGSGETKQNLIAGSIDPNTDFRDFRFQPKTNADNYLLRAQDQGFWESLSKSMLNATANVPLDIVQGVGYLGTLFDMGDDRDYNNALTREIDKLKNPFGEVYLEHPNQTFDLKDSAWWQSNFFNLGETAAAFALEGAGIGKLLGTLAEGAAWSTRAAKIGARAAQGLSAATLTYMEGAMSGAQVYDTAYNNNYMKLLHQGTNPNAADEQAKHIASQAAAATVQLHMALNMGLNLTSLAPIFREPEQAIVSWWKKNGAALPGETKDAWMARIAAAAPEEASLHKLLDLGIQGPAKLGLEAFQEGLEEVNTQYAEHVGKSIGEGKEQKDVAGRLTDLSRYFDETLNQEGALNMVLGAFGGLAQTALIERIPIHKVVKYGPDGKPLMIDGKPQTERISAHTMNERLNRAHFDNIKDALTKDMTWFAQKNQELETALKNKDLATLARVRADLLSVHNLRAISMGMGDAWKQQYQDIANLDNVRSVGESLQPQLEQLTQQMQDAFNNGDVDTANQLNAQRLQVQDQINKLQNVTEAMQKGFAENNTDNTYKEKAMQAVQNLDYLTDLYDKMQNKYTGTPQMEQAGLADHMFYRHANQYLQKQQLDAMNQDLMKLKAKVDMMNLSDQDDILVGQAKDFMSDKEVLDNTIKKLNQDISRINEAVKNKDSKVFLKMLDKYKIPSTPTAAKDLIDAIERRKSELQRRVNDTSKSLDDAVELWKQNNPEADVNEVFQKAGQKPLLEDLLQQNKQYYQQALGEYQIAKDQLAKDSTEAGIKKFLQENKPESEKQQNKGHIDAYNQQMDREIAADMDAKQKQSQVQKIDTRIKELTTTIAEDQSRLNTVNQELKNLKGFFKTFGKRLILVEDKEKYEHAIKVNTHELNVLQNRRAALVEDATAATKQAANVSRSPAPVVQPVTNVAPASQPAENTTSTESVEQAQEYADTLPAFDFSEEVIPKFTTLEDGHAVFDRIMGGTEAGNTFRQFVNLRKGSEIPFFIDSMEKMLKKVNLPVPTTEELNKFVYPYLNALREQYHTQKKNPAELYEELKGFLKPDVLTILDILEGEFRDHGFSYDRAIQVLNQQVSAGNLQKNMVGPVVNQLKDYLEFVQQPTSTEPTHIAPAEAATSSTTKKDFVFNDLNKAEDSKLSELLTAALKGGTLQDIQNLRDYVAQTYPIGDVKTGKPPMLFYITNDDNLDRPFYYFKAEWDKDDLVFEGDQNRFGGMGFLPKNITFSKDRTNLTSIFKGDNVRAFVVDTSEIKDMKLFLAKAKTVSQISGDSKVETKEFNEEPGTYIPPIADSEPTVFSNAALNTETVQEELKKFVGAQNIEAVKANYNTHPYKEFDNSKQVRIVSDYTELDPGVNTDVLVPGMVVPGDDVIFEVDENFTGEINYDTEMMQDDYGDQLRRADSFQNYLEAPGRIGMASTAAHPRGAHANVPIKIIQKSTGKTLGYLPRADWITAKYPDTGNYRNVTDTYQDQGETVTDNVARQYARIIKLRENIARAWNTNPNLKLTTVVSKRGTGHIMLNREVNPNSGDTKLINRSAKNMLPDTSLEIAIMKQGSAYVASGTLTSKQMNARIPGYMKDATSLPIVMLPSPDGTHVPAPLYTHRLGDNPSQLNTVVGAIELYLRAVADQQRPGDQKAIDRIRESSGHDIRLASGLRNFVQQYFTYTQKFGEKDTVITPSEVSSAIPEFMLDIPDEMPGEKAAFIKVGTSFSGEKPIYAQLVNGQLHPDFDQALREGLKDRFKNVVFAGKELRGINSIGGFSAPIIRKDGTVQVNKYESYNEYVKANSTTYVYGLNKVGNNYVYMANPVVQVDYDEALKSAPPVISTAINEEQTRNKPSDEQLFQEPDELADLFGNGILSPSPGSVQPLQVPSEGEQVTLEFLQELRNITPEAHRNSKTPEQVLRELLERGVMVLADGHNPFYVC